MRAIRRLLAGVGLLAGVLGLPSHAIAAEVCGDGTTFTVVLPSLDGGPSDSVTLPHGCRIYALLVSGYARNATLDELTFYKLAKFVTENNGYVHWAWWNNLLKEYMARALHPEDTFTNPITGRVFEPNSGGLPGVNTAGFAPLVHELGIVPKAVPEEDFQFLADAKKMLAAIRAEHPDAIIVVAGHSMGAGAVAHLGASTPVDIDLLAPIDPVGNRSSPVGRPTATDPRPDHTYNWTRWRITRDFAGFRVRDCVRGAFPLCENFGTFFNPVYHCRTVGALLTAPPLFPGTLSVHCPGPWIDPGKTVVFGGHVKRLYHRWQNEALFPFDFLDSYFFSHWAPRNAGGPTSAINVQLPLTTCKVGLDPRDPARVCNPTDGHGEVVGFRTPTPGQPNPPGPNIPVAPLAVQALNWPQFDESQSQSERAQKAQQRRALLLEMPTADNSWSHRPINPSLDLVADDMVTILKQLLTANVESRLTTVATPTPGPNENGWNNEDVVVNLTATPGPGRTVTQIQYSLSGAQNSGPILHAGDSVDVPITAQGDTTVTFFAKDGGGTVEEPQQLTVRIDKTPPTITGTANPMPNANGWNNTNVTVTFTAEDALSGIATVDPSVTLTSEGAGLEANGSATDLAGNTTGTTALVNIDRTPPLVFGLPEASCTIWPPNQQFVVIANVNGSDGLSGVVPGSLNVAGLSSEPEGRPGKNKATDVIVVGGGVQVRADRNGNGPGRTYTVNAQVSDKAGNVTRGSGSCFVPHDQRRR